MSHPEGAPQEASRRGMRALSTVVAGASPEVISLGPIAAARCVAPHVLDFREHGMAATRTTCCCRRGDHVLFLVALVETIVFLPHSHWHTVVGVGVSFDRVCDPGELVDLCMEQEAGIGHASWPKDSGLSYPWVLATSDPRVRQFRRHLNETLRRLVRRKLNVQGFITER